MKYCSDDCLNGNRMRCAATTYPCRSIGHICLDKIPFNKFVFSPLSFSLCIVAIGVVGIVRAVVTVVAIVMPISMPIPVTVMGLLMAKVVIFITLIIAKEKQFAHILNELLFRGRRNNVVTSVPMLLLLLLRCLLLAWLTLLGLLLCLLLLGGLLG